MNDHPSSLVVTFSQHVEYPGCYLSRQELSLQISRYTNSSRSWLGNHPIQRPKIPPSSGIEPAPGIEPLVRVKSSTLYKSRLRDRNFK